MYINRNEKFYLRKKTEGYCDEASIQSAESAINAFFGFDDDFKEKKQEPIKGFEEKDCFVDIAWKRFHKTFTKNLCKILDSSK